MKLSFAMLDDMVCLLYYFKFFKGCLPQILLGPFLNALCYLGPCKDL